MKIFNYSLIITLWYLFFTFNLNAQNSCIGGGEIIVELVCIEMLAGGEVGDEEITVLTTITDNAGNTLVLDDCATEDADLGSGGTSSMLGPGFSTMNIPIPYTPGGNYGDNNDFPNTIDICFDVWEDDRGGRCTLDINGGIFDNDDDNNCTTNPCTTVDIASIWGAGGACPEALGAADPCVDTAPNIFRVNCNGDWNLTYQVYLNLEPPVVLECPGFLSPSDAPVTLNASEAGTTDLLSGGTWSILSGGGSITDNGDGSATFDPAGTIPGMSVQVAYTGDNCCRTIETSCFIAIVECPALDVVTMDGDGCIGDNVMLSASVTPATAVENQDFVIVWQEDGVDIPGSSSAGPDGVPGNADDISTLNYTHTLPGTGVDGCTSTEHTYTAQLYCITNFTLEEGDSNEANASTDPADTVIPYNASGLTCVDLDLSSLPACALAGSFDYNTVVTSGPPFGLSYICEALLEVQTPVGNQGPFCDPFFGGTCPATGSGSSCIGTPLAGPGTNTFSGNSSFGGLSSTTPAQGLWSACFSDSFNDTGGTEGVVNYILLDIQALLPPGCSINGAGSSMDAMNIGSPANNPAAVTVCTAPNLGTDFTAPTGCDNFAITDLCGTLEIGYATSAAGPFDTALADASSLVTPANGEMVFYEIRLPGCPDCAVTTGSWTLMGCCSVTEPTTTGSAVCEDQSGSLTATPGMNCTTINWFSDAGGTAMVGSGGTFNPADTAPGTYTYYAQCVDASIADCESMLVPADFVVNALPVVTLSTPALACGSGPQALNPSPAGGIYSGTGAPFVTNDAIDGEDLTVGVPYNLTYTYTTPEGCTGSAMITFTFTPDCDANGGSFPSTGP